MAEFTCFFCDSVIPAGYYGGVSCASCNAWYNVTPFGSYGENPNVNGGAVYSLAEGVPGKPGPYRILLPRPGS